MNHVIKGQDNKGLCIGSLVRKTRIVNWVSSANTEKLRTVFMKVIVVYHSLLYYNCFVLWAGGLDYEINLSTVFVLYGHFPIIPL